MVVDFKIKRIVLNRQYTLLSIPINELWLIVFNLCSSIKLENLIFLLDQFLTYYINFSQLYSEKNGQKKRDHGHVSIQLKLQSLSSSSVERIKNLTKVRLFR